MCYVMFGRNEGIVVEVVVKSHFGSGGWRGIEGSGGLIYRCD